jgi:DNA-binding XRE family transcriptional regulator
MGYEPQRFQAPDGTQMVVLVAADYDRLLEAFDDAGDVAVAEATLRAIEDGEGTIPSEVLMPILNEGISPIASWRHHRSMSQAELARRAGISQVWLGRIEAGVGYGTPRTRKALAAALGAPDWSLDIEDESERKVSPVPVGQTRPFPSKSAEIRHLLGSGQSRADIARQMGIRYQFVRNVDITRLSK